jgi:hypothetical protein
MNESENKKMERLSAWFDGELDAIKQKAAELDAQNPMARKNLADWRLLDRCAAQLCVPPSDASAAEVCHDLVLKRILRRHDKDAEAETSVWANLTRALPGPPEPSTARRAEARAGMMARIQNTPEKAQKPVLRFRLVLAAAVSAAAAIIFSVWLYTDHETDPGTRLTVQPEPRRTPNVKSTPPIIIAANNEKADKIDATLEDELAEVLDDRYHLVVRNFSDIESEVVCFFLKN